MNKPHVHKDVIIAWASGAQIQISHKGVNGWADCSSPCFYQDKDYRVKPEPSLSSESDEALTRFDAAAKNWGWTEEEGSGARAVTSEKEYYAAHNALVSRILELEKLTNN